MDRLSKVRMDKSKFLSIPSCSKKESQSIVDVMMENVPNGDGKLLNLYCIFCIYICNFAMFNNTVVACLVKTEFQNSATSESHTHYSCRINMQYLYLVVW